MTQSKRRKQKPGRPEAKVKVPPPGDRENAAIAAARQRASLRKPTVKVRVGASDENIPTVGNPHSDFEGWKVRLTDAFGTASFDFAQSNVAHLLTIFDAKSDGARQIMANAALAVVSGLQPKDEIEAILSMHVAVNHALAMEFAARCKQAQQL